MNNDSANPNGFTYTNMTGTTPGNLTSAFTTAVIATPYVMLLDGVLQNSAAADTVTIYAQTGVTTSAVSIEPGSYCAIVY